MLQRLPAPCCLEGVLAFGDRANAPVPCSPQVLIGSCIPPIPWQLYQEGLK